MGSVLCSAAGVNVLVFVEEVVAGQEFALQSGEDDPVEAGENGLQVFLVEGAKEPSLDYALFHRVIGPAPTSE